MAEIQTFDTISLRELVERLGASGLLIETIGPVERMQIDHVSADSRKVGPGGLFVAVRGVASDGHLFIEKAVQNGATAIVCETMPEAPMGASGVGIVRVSEARVALSALAASGFRDPSAALQVVGVTGTNGKSTTAWLVDQALQHLGVKSGLLGTIEYRIGERVEEAPLTTPDAVTLHAHLRAMINSGIGVCAMEVSSHALDQNRADHVDFDVAVFTNLTRDHLDYHGSVEAYARAKKRLFDLLRPGSTSLYNAEDPYGPRLVADTHARKLSFGRTPDADVHVEILDNRVDGLHLKINGQTMHSRLVGEFNALNLAAAYGAVTALGHPSEHVLGALEEADPVPGRFQQWKAPTGTTVIVDYAHTPDALDNVLKAARNVLSKEGKIWCVFGAGGDRDRGKRPEMGAVVERWADRIVITSDNPRSEDPLAIIGDILSGLSKPEAAMVLENRSEAIRLACREAAPEDVVIIAGKGHETYQIISGERLPFDDRAEARRAFGIAST